MKNQDFVSNDHMPACDLCEHGTLSRDGTAVLCAKKGIMAPEDRCRKFVYDPLKREPKPRPVLSAEYSEEDFTIE